MKDKPVGETRIIRLSVLLISTVVSWATPVNAETYVGPSLEWLVDHCFESGIYTVASATDHDPSAKVEQELKLELKERLRGEPSAKLDQVYRDAVGARPVVEGDQFLVFFRHRMSGGKNLAGVFILVDDPETISTSFYFPISCDLKFLKTKQSGRTRNCSSGLRRNWISGAFRAGSSGRERTTSLV